MGASQSSRKVKNKASMNTNDPLFVGERPSSTDSNERAAQEDDALLGTRDSFRPPRKANFWKDLVLLIWSVFATATVVILAIVYHRETHREHGPTKHTGKRNLVFMVSDGMGPASLSMTRSFRQYTEGLPIDNLLTLDKHLIGSSRTRSSNSLVTDSAAGATAFSCGLKSYNGAISMLPDHTPCGTILEAAKKAGYLTGLVVTTDITDATPACFASHVNMRFECDAIASQEVGEHPLGRVVDLMLGGGRCHFLPNSTSGSCRQDGRDVTKLAQEKYGWNYIETRKEFDVLKRGATVKLPLLGLFAMTDIPFEIDRRNLNDIYPSLDEMAEVALKALSEASKDNEKGFFLMIEGSRIDHGGHFNDPAAQVHEVLAYDKTFSRVIDFLDQSPEQGRLIATSDHETGGLSVARQLNIDYPQYLWYPGVLANASNSAEFLANELNKHILNGGGSKTIREYIKGLVKDGLGIHDATKEELDRLFDFPLFSLYAFADMISRRAQIGWSTHGHSAVDVNIYAYPAEGSETVRGNHENIEVGRFLQDYLDLDVKPITQELRKSLSAFSTLQSDEKPWTGRIPTEAELKERFEEHEKHRFA